MSNEWTLPLGSSESSKWVSKLSLPQLAVNNFFMVPLDQKKCLTVLFVIYFSLNDRRILHVLQVLCEVTGVTRCFGTHFGSWMPSKELEFYLDDKFSIESVK